MTRRILMAIYLVRMFWPQMLWGAFILVLGISLGLMI